MPFAFLFSCIKACFHPGGMVGITQPRDKRVLTFRKAPVHSTRRTNEFQGRVVSAMSTGLTAHATAHATTLALCLFARVPQAGRTARKC